MRIARAFIAEKGLVTINLNKDIMSLDSVKFVDNIELLRKKLDNEKDKNIIGIAYFTVGKIILKNDNTYTCKVFASMETVRGTWSIS